MTSFFIFLALCAELLLLLLLAPALLTPLLLLLLATTGLVLMTTEADPSAPTRTMERVEAALRASSELLLSSPLALQEEQVGLVLGKGNR